MSDTVKTMTPEHAEAMGEDVKRSIETAEQQLSEHKLWLVDQLRGLQSDIYGVSDAQWVQLIEQVSGIKTEMVRVTPKFQRDKKWYGPMVTLINSYPDELHAFLQRADIPREMQLSYQGGYTIPDELVRVATEEDEN
jgi:hypothetical protein